MVNFCYYYYSWMPWKERPGAWLWTNKSSEAFLSALGATEPSLWLPFSVGTPALASVPRDRPPHHNYMALGKVKSYFTKTWGGSP